MTARITTHRYRIDTPSGSSLVLVLESLKAARGVLVVLHGLGGCKEQPFIRELVATAHSCGLSAVTFDAFHTFGESGGRYQSATITSYADDLEAVLLWVRQNIAALPVVVCGHSIGGTAAAHLHAAGRDDSNALLLIAPVISAELTIKAAPALMSEWRRRGYLAPAKGESIAELPWTHMLDRMKYDLLRSASAILVPTLVLVGSNDKSTPPSHQRQLVAALPHGALAIIPQMSHTPITPTDLIALRTTVTKWLAVTLRARLHQ